MKKYAIIVAGGSGQRMQSAVPKQFLLLQGKPVLYHTLAAFYQADASTEIILVLPVDQFSYWETLIAGLPPIPHRLVAGGNSRFQSSQQAIQTLSEDGMVAIHDGVRPLINPALISSSFQAASEKGNAVLAVASKDSVRFYSADKKIRCGQNRLFVERSGFFKFAQRSEFADLRLESSGLRHLENRA